ncbi:protein tramtrack, beta isoform-like isoform X2 [Pectinophora gossypiella]|nr:protein tramtrack, beta isoform-like isoform X2 [Pectinophora gossypiella]
MTLAADGHFVKVHQVLMALASPYLKELISSAPCQHPVIFLNNVSYKTLSCLLEYVYTGEVLVPSENLITFVEAAKALHIKGLEDFHNPEEICYKPVDTLSQLEDNIPCHGIKNLSVPDEQGSTQIGLPAAARKVLIKTPAKMTQTTDNKTKREVEMDMSYTEMMNVQDSDDDMEAAAMSDCSSKTVTDDTGSTPHSNLQFSVSIRGSLQVILNRYIYNLHSVIHRSGVKRWRCVDYRNHRCKAFIVTKGNVVLNRANLHNHSFHDKKILQKIEKKAVFTALDEIEAFKQKEDHLENTESEAHYITLDFSDVDNKLKKTV